MEDGLKDKGSILASRAAPQHPLLPVKRLIAWKKLVPSHFEAATTLPAPFPGRP
jgi:hypothetical protein